MKKTYIENGTVKLSFDNLILNVDINQLNKIEEIKWIYEPLICE